MASLGAAKPEQTDFEGKSRVINVNDEDVDSSKAKEVEIIVRDTLGDFGWWQARVCFCLSLLRIPISWHELSIVFLAPPPGNYFCTGGSSTDAGNFTSQNGPFNELDKCYYNKTGLLNDENGENSTILVPCQRWIYDHFIFGETIISEWDLVCQRSQLANVAQSSFMFGILLGSVFFGMMSDKIGRKRPLLAAIALQTLTGIGTAYIPSFEGFLVLRFLIAFATGGIMMTSFVICMEIVGGWWRTAAPILYHLPFGLGYSLLGGISYYFRNWRSLQLAISLPCILLLSYWWLIPESPRWLLAMNHHREAKNVLTTAAKVNGRVWNDRHFTSLKINHGKHKIKASSKKENTSSKVNNAKEVSNKVSYVEKELKPGGGNIFDLLRTPNLRCKTLIITYSWLAAGLAFFGTAQYTSRLGGNIFINVAISGATQILGTFASWYGMHKFGRRKTLLASQLFSGASCLLIACVLKEREWLLVGLAANGLIGLAVVHSTNYLYSCELFPTVVRNAGIGVSSMCARIGSLTAPFIATMDTIHPLIPPITFGIFPLLAGVLVLLLPETSSQHLPDTIQEGEDFGKKSQVKNITDADRT